MIRPYTYARFVLMVVVMHLVMWFIVFPHWPQPQPQHQEAQPHDVP